MRNYNLAIGNPVLVRNYSLAIGHPVLAWPSLSFGNFAVRQKIRLGIGSLVPVFVYR